jgi:hypothetical protein
LLLGRIFPICALVAPCEPGASAFSVFADFRDRTLGGPDAAGAAYFFRLLLRDRDRERPPRFAGTLPPARRACESPMAMACLRLVTFLPERPDRSWPRLRSCIAFSTF